MNNKFNRADCAIPMAIKGKIVSIINCTTMSRKTGCVSEHISDNDLLHSQYWYQVKFW